MTGCSLLVSSSGLSGGADAVDSGAGGDAGRLPDGAPADVITARDAANGDGDAEPPSDPSLVLWLRFDEAVQGTSLKDSSSYAGAAALQGTAKVVSGGHVGGALALDGSTSCYVSIPHRPELLQLT